MDPIRRIRLLFIAAAVLTAGLMWVVYDSFSDRIVEAGQSAPSFKLVTESGRTVTPRAFGGKLLVVNFWATWCPPCVEETPSLNAMASQLGREGVVVVGVSVDRNERAYRAFLERMKIGFETTRDADAKVSASFGTFKYPETYVITPDGKVVEKYIAGREWTSPEILSQLRSHL